MIEDLLPDLECPVCNEYYYAPILQCVSGHSICKTCKDKLVLCPICKQKFSNVRNFSLEGLLSKIKVKCHHEHCEAECDMEAMRQHKSICLYETTKCIIPGCKAIIVRSNLKEHIITAHKSIFISNGKELKSHQIGFSVMEYNGQLFWIRRFSEEGIIFYAVQHMFPTKENEKYYYTIKLNNYKGDTYMLKQPCIESNVKESDLKKKEQYCTFYRCYFRHPDLKIIVSIEKKKKTC